MNTAQVVTRKMGFDGMNDALSSSRRINDDDDPYGVRFGNDCDWCNVELWQPTSVMRRPIGIRFDVSHRHYQILTRTRSQSEMPKGKDGRQTPDTTPRMGVQPNWPLKMWWVTAEKHDPELIAGLPPYEELACPRCNGTGKRKN